MEFRDRLITALDQLDQRETAQEVKRKIRPNIYRIAHYLKAADDVMHAIDRGVDASTAFADTFVPTRGMHRVARTLGLRLDVQRGQWVKEEQP